MDYGMLDEYLDNQNDEKRFSAMMYDIYRDWCRENDRARDDDSKREFLRSAFSKGD